MHPSVHSSSIYNRKTWKQTKHPLADERIKTCYIYWNICTMEYDLALREDKTTPFAATWRDLTIIIQRKRNIVWYHLYCCSATKLCPTLWGLMDCRTHITCMWNLKKKKKYKWTYLQNRNKLTEKNTYGYYRGKRVGGGIRSLGLTDTHWGLKRTTK